MQRLRGVVTILKLDDAGIERSGDGEGFEGRAHLIDAVAGAVEAGIAWIAPGIAVGIETG